MLTDVAVSFCPTRACWQGPTRPLFPCPYHTSNRPKTRSEGSQRNVLASFRLHHAIWICKNRINSIERSGSFKLISRGKTVGPQWIRPDTETWLGEWRSLFVRLNLFACRIRRRVFPVVSPAYSSISKHRGFYIGFNVEAKNVYSNSHCTLVFVTLVLFEPIRLRRLQYLRGFDTSIWSISIDPEE